MKIRLERTYNNDVYCIGHLYVDGKYVCDTIEDTDRGLNSNMPLEQIKKVKVKSKTAIPAGIYRVTLNVKSPKFSLKQYYSQFCSGYVPRLLDVPGFDGILMHRGTTEKDSAGCIILGYNKLKGMVVDSTKAFEKLYGMMQLSHEPITIEIIQKWK